MFFGRHVDWARWHPRMLGVLRIVATLLFLQHGLQKLIGFPAPMPPGFTFVSIFGLACAVEVIGGLLLLLGLFSREAAFVMSGEMAVAYFYMGRPQASLFPLVNRGELEALYCFVFLYLAVAGPGAWALDNSRAATRRWAESDLARR